MASWIVLGLEIAAARSTTRSCLDRVRSATSSTLRGTRLACRVHPAHEAIERSADLPGAPAWSVIAEAAATRSPWWHGRFTCRRMRYEIARGAARKGVLRVQQ